MQADQPPLSRLHSKLEPASLEAKAKLAELEVVVPVGPLVIEVCGEAVSGDGDGGVGDCGEIKAAAGLAGPGLGAGMRWRW